MTARGRARWIISLALCLGVLWIYWPLRNHEFVNFDDSLYVSDNPRVLQGLSWDGLLWAFNPSTIVAGNWHPIALLSHMLDCELYGANPAGHHLSSLLLHLINAILLFLLLHRMTGSLGRSGLVAALFAVHPLNVESVAWIAERKNVLSTLLWLLTMLAYLSYARRPSARRFVPVIALFLAGLAAKPMLVTLPFVLLLIDYWPLRRFAERSWPQLLREKIPLLVLVLLFCLVTLRVQSASHAVHGYDSCPLELRASNAVWSYAAYIQKTAWPGRLAAYYPHPEAVPPAWRIVLAAAIVLLPSLAFVLLRRRAPYLPVGWFWFLGTLVPVIGLVQVGGQAMADRYAYVPTIGLFVAAVWAAHAALTRTRLPAAGLIAVALLVVTPLGLIARAQVRHWRDSETLFEQALRVTDNNAFAHNNLGTALTARGRLNEARAHFARAVEQKPGYATAQMNLGTVLLRQGDLDGAARHLSLAVQIDPGDAEAHSNLGTALLRMGDLAAGIRHLRTALQIDPELQEARNNLKAAEALDAQR